MVITFSECLLKFFDFVDNWNVVTINVMRSATWGHARVALCCRQRLLFVLALKQSCQIWKMKMVPQRKGNTALILYPHVGRYDGLVSCKANLSVLRLSCWITWDTLMMIAIRTALFWPWVFFIVNFSTNWLLVWLSLSLLVVFVAYLSYHKKAIKAP